MKKIVVSVVLGAIAIASHAARLNVVEVGLPAINCLFNTNCTNSAEERFSPITLRGTTGTGYVHSRVITGERGSLAAGHFGYEYQVDLSGIVTGPTNPTVLTNIVRCQTNRVEVRTNQVVCRTNIVGAVNMVVCTTNRIPATNVFACFTNIIAGTNIQRCVTNAAGAVVCFTNNFPAITNVVCFSNQVPARTIVTCQTNSVIPGVGVTVCTTNSVRYHTNVLVCRTNTTTAPESPPCVTSLRVHIGSAVARLDLNGDGTNTDNVYVVASGGAGSVAPSSVEWDDNDLVVHFSPPLCAGDTSLTVGIVARSGPQRANAKMKLTAGSSLRAPVLAPGGSSAFTCDFEALANAIRDLRTRDFTGANNQVRENRRAALIEMVYAAHDAAQADDLDEVAEALGALISKVDGRGQDWVTEDGRKKLKDELKDLVECLEEAQEEAEDRDDDDDDDDNDDDDECDD